MVGIADAHGVVLDSPYSSADRGAVVIVLDEAKRWLHAELLGCRASDPGWWIARIYPAPMRPEMDRRSRLPSPRQHARGCDLVHDDSRGAFVLDRAIPRFWPVHAAALAILLTAAAVRSESTAAHLRAGCVPEEDSALHRCPETPVLGGVAAVAAGIDVGKSWFDAHPEPGAETVAVRLDCARRFARLPPGRLPPLGSGIPPATG